MPPSTKILVLSTLVAAALTGLVCAYVNAKTESGIYETTMRGYAASRNFQPPTEKQKIRKAIRTVAAAQGYSDSTLSEWLELLAQKESGNTAHIRVLDVNNKYSYGCLQFQMGTWIGMGKTYGVATTPDNIYDCQLQKNLAYLMISESYENWRHWGYTVRTKMTLPPII